jgi:hypothetical protein
VAFIGGLIWALCAQTGDDPARVVNAGCEKDRVGTILERIMVERLLDPVFAVALTCTVNVVPPQIPLDRRLREYDGAFALRIPTAGTQFQADKVAARGLSLGNGHSCPFLGQPATTTSSGCQSSVSRHGLLGFQLAIRSFPEKRPRAAKFVLQIRLPMASWQSHVDELLLVVIHLSAPRRSLTVNHLKCVYGNVRISGTLSLRVE